MALGAVLKTPSKNTQNLAPPIDLVAEADFRLGRLQVQPSNCRVVWENVITNLQPKVMQVLVALAQGQGRVVSREELVQRCWNGVVVGDDSIHRCVARLRKLSDDTAPAFSIETQARVGYRLIIDAKLDDLTSTTSVGRSPNPLKRHLLLVAALIGTALIATGVILRLVQTPPSPYLLAVRSFRVYNADPALGDSIATRIADAVADRQLAIVSPRRSMKGDLDGARYVLNGEIQIQQGLAKAIVDLDNAVSGTTVWSTSAARPASELDDLQDQVAGKVVDQLGLLQRWLGADGSNAKPEAVATLIKATEFMRRGPEAMLETRDSFRRFRDLEPHLSRAHSAFAMSTALSASNQPPEVAAQWRRQAADEARLAIALDPHNGEGYMALGALTPWRDIAKQETFYRQGLLADPNDPSLFDFLGELLLGVGRTDEAVEWIDRSVRADPFSSPKTQSLISALSTNGHFDQAKLLFARAKRLWPDDAAMHRVILFSSLVYAEPILALSTLEEFQRGDKPLENSRAEAWRELEKYRLDRKLKSPGSNFIKSTSASIKDDDLSASVIALSLIGDRASAFKLLSLVDEKSIDFDIRVIFGPAAKTLRNSPIVEKIERQLSLDKYWLATHTKPDFCRAQTGVFPCLDLRH